MKEQRRTLIDKFQAFLDTKPRQQIIAAECANIAENYQALQLPQTDVSNKEVAVAFTKWLTEKDSKYAILYGGTPELEKDYRLATLEGDFTIEEVFEEFKKATDY